MGVHGLWQLLQATGRPVSLESLEGKILAVDVSIWLHHLMKGMRDRDGSPLPNAHLQGLFTRVCKLLFYRIKPVFVFDGGVPLLKKQTLAARRERKEMAQQESSRMKEKLLTNLIRSQAIQQAMSKDGSGKSSPASLSPVRKPTSQAAEPDLFELPPQQVTEISSDDESGEELWEAGAIQDEFQDLGEVDIDSEEFKSLPPELQYELLSEMKKRRKENPWAIIEDLPEDSGDFSQYQMAKLMKQNKLSHRLEETRKVLNARSSWDVTSRLGRDVYGGEIQSQRVVSDSKSHYILIKGLKKQKQEKHQGEEVSKLKTDSAHNAASHSKNSDDKDNITIDLRDELIEGSDDERSPSNTRQSLKPDTFLEKKQDIKNLLRDCVDSDVYIVGQSQSNDESEEKTDTTFHPGGVISIEDSSSDSLSDNPVLLKTKGGNYHQSEDADKKDIKKDTQLSTAGRESNGSDEQEVLYKRRHSVEEIEDSAKKTKMTINTLAESADVDGDSVKSILISEDLDGSQVSAVMEESEESDDDDLVEVTVKIDPEHVTDDEMFPPSLFVPAESDDESGFLEIEDKREDLPQEASKVVTVDVDEDESTRQSDVSVANVHNIAQEFQTLTEEDLMDMRTELEAETETIQSERGKQQRMATSITDQMQLEAQELLRLFGIPYVVSPMEAEAQCAQLDRAKQTHGTITDDSDTWLFGGKQVYKNFFNQSKHVEFYRDTNIATQLGLDRHRLINIALLCGSDYTEGIPTVGPVTAMEILGEFPGQGLESLKAFKRWWDEAQKQVKVPKETKLKSKLRQLEVRPGFPNPAVAEEYFHPTVDESKEDFSWSLPNLDQLRQFANEKFGWSRNKADDILLPMMKQINKKESQPRISGYLQPESFIEPTELKSKRLQSVVQKFLTTPTEPVPDTNEARMQRAKQVMRQSKGKGRGKGKGKAAREKGKGARSKVILDEVQLSESSSSDSEASGGFIRCDEDPDI